MDARGAEVLGNCGGRALFASEVDADWDRTRLLRARGIPGLPRAWREEGITCISTATRG